MFYVYKFTNKLNGKSYIGQTDNIEERKRNHKSSSFNSKSKDYKYPFHNAVRKYGWDNFDFEILEEINEDFGREYLDEREKFFIKYYSSLVKENGYNVAIGGQGCPRSKLSFEESVKLSKLFTLEEVKEIQRMLLEHYAFYEIYKKFPQLTQSFLSNINTGLNFKRDDLVYPISTEHCTYTKQTQEEIIKELQSGKIYKDISLKYNISQSLLSLINSGKKWFRKDLKYPLSKKICSDGAWSKDAKYDLIFTDLSHEEIGNRYNKAKSTITALNTGRNRKDSRLRYPLRKYQKENQEIWNTLF